MKEGGRGHKILLIIFFVGLAILPKNRRGERVGEFYTSFQDFRRIVSRVYVLVSRYASF